MAISPSSSSSSSNNDSNNTANTKNSLYVKAGIIYVIGITFLAVFSIVGMLLQQQQPPPQGHLKNTSSITATETATAVETATATRSNTSYSPYASTSNNVSVLVLPELIEVPTTTVDPNQSAIPSNPPLMLPSPPQQRLHRNITLIVQLRGELGNQLSVLANARVTQLLAQTKYPHIHIHLIGQHQSAEKWKAARDQLIQCFSSSFHDFDFEGGIYDEEFRVVQKLQQTWLTEEQQNKLRNVRSFHFLDSLLLQQEKNHDGLNSTGTGIITKIPQLRSSVSKYSLPYLTASGFSWIDCLQNEWYYNEMRQWLLFNMKKCCNPNIRPDNDVVFHYRNFAHEFRNRPDLRNRTNFNEISPHVAANVAFLNHSAVTTHDYHNATPPIVTPTASHINHAPNIAITSRYENGTDLYVTAFLARNITSHYVSGQRSGVEGFCFIMQAKQETFGSYWSTYYRWAALLGNAVLNRFYKIDTSPVSTSTVVNITPNQTGSFVNDDASRPNLIPSPLISKSTFVQGNRTFTIETYCQQRRI